MLAPLLAQSSIVQYGRRMSTEPLPPLALAVGYLKGGTAKSSSATMLALALAHRTGQTVALLDTDQANATVTMWRRVAGDNWPSTVTVERWEETDDETAAEVSRRLLASHDHLVVDTGPGGKDILRDVLTVADDLLCPVPAAPAEVMSLKPTLALAAKASRVRGVELHLLLTKVDKRTTEARETREQMDAMGLPVMATEVPARKFYRTAVGSAPTDFGAYADVLEELVSGRTNE